MALAAVNDATDITAPKLLGMDSGGARLLGAVLVGALVLSVVSDLRNVRSLPLLLLAMAVVSLGVAGILWIQSDPMPAAAAIVVSATGPIGCLLTCLAIPGPLGNSNQTNALGVGVAVCAFMCVRGRTGMAWCALTAMICIFICWSVLTGQGVLYGFVLAGPNVAILGMSTLFAYVMRPAAAAIRQLREASISQAEEIAASDAKRSERVRQRAKLRVLAWPTLTAIGRGDHLSAAQVAEIRLTEAQLRDGVRARSLSVSPLVEAARAARSRGAEVVMFDDGGFDTADQRIRAAFLDLACSWLERTNDGTITLRVHPPGRAVLGSIVVVDGGSALRVELDAAGTVLTG
jgi:hypothetical protein